MMVQKIKQPSQIDIAVAKRLNKRPDQISRADRDLVLRDLLSRRGQVPLACDRSEIPVAPARGPVLLFHPRKMVITDAGNVRAVRDGRFAAMQVQDAFHKAQVQAQSRKQTDPFTPGQIDIGRLYADLFQRCASSGMKLAQFGGSDGGGGQTGISEAVLADMQQLGWLTKRIGAGVAMVVRRVRPSLRGATVGKVARNISNQRLVHMFCVDGVTISGILKAHGWSDRSESKKALGRALCAALDRMRGVEG